ncbi:phosphomannomutase/phosphoglucomutase [Sulfuritalea hydrogenivorans]|jgi:phosphomannomutase/phosphoglucomutase|uniref:Phosphoglucomutase n=1 Tax=Sulfuritalea hydrogenivorans sk43H TaxID=1223802 RepID=W0SCG1_9PROT|nr:phosphomannomutase/phosphoglucomutase [Sulfuritalea hydrogenivorans]BAO28617.1 phosphoglucomutase [Sulfuritalea hydrogenivorans sk43H]
MRTLAPEIFKAYDIRGIVRTTLTADTVRRIGQALGSEAVARDIKAIVIGRDGRLSGPALASALADGITRTGVDVIDIGCVPTPMTYFAAHELGTESCVSVTGSHNPPEYNGLKMVLGGQTLYGEMIQDLRRRIEKNAASAVPPGDTASHNFCQGRGVVRHASVHQAYLDRIVGDVKLSRPMKIVIDCGNGVAGGVAPELFRRMGCEVTELFCEVDGNFPNHHPDPSKPENLVDLQRALRETGAELGLAFDGDGDRLGVVTRDGEIIFPDRQLMLFAADVLVRNPGAQIIYDVKCSRWLAESIRHQGGRPLMWNTGHALIKTKLKETGAPLAGEMSGHMFFKERWFGFDDALYTGARLLEIVSRWEDSNWPLKNLPNAISTPELNIKMNEGEPHALVAKLRAGGKKLLPGARELITIDGVRAEYADGFGLARASNTTPVVVLRFEADTQAALTRIQAEFRSALETLWPGIRTGF